MVEGDDNLGVHGRVMEILSEHTLEGWLEGYLLTGRHGFFSCYEAFIHIVDSMFNQHAKWLPDHPPAGVAAADRLAELPADLARVAAGPQRVQPPGPRLHRPRRQQEGRGHPGLPAPGREHAALGRGPLPAQQEYVNVIVAGKQPALQYLPMDDADRPLHQGHRDLGVGQHRPRRRPDVVFGCAGDIPTQEALAAVDILLGFFPDLKVRFVNVVDLMRLQDTREHPHGLSDVEFDALFTTDRPVIFAYHGYPWLIHRLTYRRRTTGTSTSVATRRRGRRPRRSTWR